MSVIVEPADIFLTRGTSFVSAAIRFLTRSTGESRTKVNHVGIVTGIGGEGATIVEALTKVKRRQLKSYWGKKNTDVAIFRPINLTHDEKTLILDKADSYVGASYGYGKIVAHFLDWCLGGAYVFRRIARMDKYPICSWLVAYAYAEAGKDFGVPAGAASPDDIWDFVVANPDKYTCVHPLEMLS